MQCHHFFSSEDVDVINCFIFMLLYRPVIRNLTECQLIPNVAQGFFNPPSALWHCSLFVSVISLCPFGHMV